jgi:hypothetical protein
MIAIRARVNSALACSGLVACAAAAVLAERATHF